MTLTAVNPSLNRALRQWQEADSGSILHCKNTFLPTQEWQQKEQNWPKIRGHRKHHGINTGTSDLVVAVELGNRAKA